MPSVGRKRREQEAARKKIAQAAENEIYPLPPIGDFRRRVECERDPERWLKTYLPKIFSAPFSPSQTRLIGNCWDAIRADSSKSVNAYRGFGKTSIFSGLMLMCLACGRFRHAYYVAAEGGKSKEAADWFAKILHAPFDIPWADVGAFGLDYPEIFYPIRRRRNVANKPLTYRGEPCAIKIGPALIQLPTIAGSPSSGSALKFTSARKAIRGSSHTIRGVGNFRVAAVMFDDVQTDANARSEKETGNIVDTIISSVNYLSGKENDGRKEPLVVLSAITQNRPGDVAEQLRVKMPQLNAEIIPFLRSVPSDFGEWRKYRDKFVEIYNANPENPALSRSLLNDYYRSRQTEIERDCVADDPRIFERTQLSAVQYALEKWCVSQRSFWCELQNDAARGAQEEDGLLTPIVVLRKKRPVRDGEVRTLKRWQVPDETAVMTAHVDVGDHYLNYEVVAFGPDGAFSHVVDFGIWPEQNYPTTSKKVFRRDLQEVYRRGDRFDRVRDAIVDCLRHIFEQQYFNANGAPISVDDPSPFERGGALRGKRFCRLALCGVDSSDGEAAPAIWDAVSTFHRLGDGRFYGRALPTYGDAAKSRLLRFYDLKPGEWRRGAFSASTCDWIENPTSRRRELDGSPAVPACLLYDANTYKTRRDEAWRLPTNRPGASSLFDGDDPEYLAMFAEQQCSEEVKSEKKISSQLYKIWDFKKPRAADNEFLDTDSACRALAHYVGVESTIERPRPLEIKWTTL